ncbi:LRAT domain [Dillenia turbinata]|uniref:LRAT domain n=1 Tax=Dillenia turbinata TaxID=194707 RepID=A0AAN8ZJJ8_9MAGN
MHVVSSKGLQTRQSSILTKAVFPKPAAPETTMTNSLLFGNLCFNSLNGLSNPNLSVARNCECGFDPNKDHGVVKSCLECFVSGHKLRRVKYEVSSIQLLLKRAGTCSTENNDDAKTVLQRIETLLKENSFSKYNLVLNNYESFAKFCKTGKAMSKQVVAAGIALGAIGTAIGTDLAVREISEDSNNDEDQLSRTKPKSEENKKIQEEYDNHNDHDEDYHEDDEEED